MFVTLALRRSGEADFGLAGCFCDFLLGRFSKSFCGGCCSIAARGEREELEVALAGGGGSDFAVWMFRLADEGTRDGSFFCCPLPSSAGGDMNDTVGFFALTGKLDFPSSHCGVGLDTFCCCPSFDAWNRSRKELVGLSFADDGRFSFPDRDRS